MQVYLSGSTHNEAALQSATSRCQASGDCSPEMRPRLQTAPEFKLWRQQHLRLGNSLTITST
jgi:positive regulator of sigma E activity